MRRSNPAPPGGPTPGCEAGQRPDSEIRSTARGAEAGCCGCAFVLEYSCRRRPGPQHDPHTPGTAPHRSSNYTHPAPRGTCASPANPMVLHRAWCASSRPLSTRARYTEVRHRVRNYSAARVTPVPAPSTPPRPRPRPLAPSPRPPLSKVVNASQAQTPCMHVLTMAPAPLSPQAQTLCMHVLTMAPAPLSPQAQTQSTCMPLIISRYARWARSLST